MNILTQTAVNTTNGATIKTGFVQISADIREVTKDGVVVKAVADHERYRNIVIPELLLPQVEDSLRLILLAKLYELAAEQFKSLMTDSNRMATTVELADYTVTGLLKFYNTDAKNGRMTKEAISEWFSSSATATYIKGKNAGALKGYADNYAKVASPNHGLNPNTCRSLIAVLQPADTTHAIAAFIVTRLQQTITKSEVSQVVDL